MDGSTGNLSLGVTNEPRYFSRVFYTLIIIFIVMKLAVWIEAPVNAEQIMSEKNLYENEGPFVENPYADVDEEEEEYGDRTDYR